MVLLCTTLAAPLANPAFAEDRTITVEGTAHLRVAPDRADIDIGVATNGKTVADALSRNAPVMQAVVQAIERAGVSPKDIRTNSFEVAPINPRLPNGDTDSSRTIGYSAINQLSISVVAMDRIGEVIDAAARAGATDTGRISYSLANDDAVLAQVRAEAMRDARRKAEELVAPEHKTVGELVAVGRGISGLDENLPTMLANFSGPVTAEPQAEMRFGIQIVPGEITISATVVATFALQ
ncbi:MAG TPA: SIMPL domain-containing protein [Rhizomicrobium sp.]|jgi:uncharacterized protein YggE